jgi:glycosyltransferase involved in cell wall biosynthesis
LKILNIIHTLDPSVGGVASAVLALSRELAERGHKVDVITLDEPGAPWLAQDGLTIHPLGIGLSSYRYSRALSRWLRKHGGDYDCVMVHGLWQHLSFAAWRRYAGSAIPYYVFPHGMLDPWFKRTFPLKHVKKWLYWPWADYRVLRDAAAVIFTSEEERLQARESFWLYRCHEKVSPLGVAVEPVAPQARDQFLERYPELQNSDALLFLGRLHPKKGCDLLIDALAGSSDTSSVSIILAGPDQIGWEQELRARVAQHDLQRRIIFTGMLHGATKQGALASASAFILPSHQENFGMSVVEALAAGLPVLISNRINIWREIDDDRAGYVDDDDLAGTQRLIKRWVETDPKEREAMRTNARRCFAERFEIHRAVDSLLQILTESRAAT